MRVLLEKETVFAEEFEMIMDGASADEVMKVIDDRTYRNFGKKEKKDKQSGIAYLGAANGTSETDGAQPSDGGSDSDSRNE